MKSEKIPFDIDNIGYIVRWEDHYSYDDHGETLVRYIEDLNGDIEWRLKKKDWVWLDRGYTVVRQFTNLADFLKGKRQKWVSGFHPDKLPDNRYLTEKEKNILYDTLKHKLVDSFKHYQLAGWVLSMFYKEY